MKVRRLSTATAVVAALFGTAIKTQAQYAPVPPNPNQGQYAFGYDSYPERTFYMGVDMGGIIMQDTKVRNAPGQTLSFDPGFRGDFFLGWHIPSTLLAVEFESGASENSLTSGGYLTPPNWKAELTQIPFLANLVLDVPLGNGFSAYVGAGAGGVASELYLHSHTFRTHDSDTDVTFDYQGKAGVKYAFNRNIEVGLDYKFLGTLSHTWFNDDPITTDPSYSHSFMASFTWNF